MEDDPVKQEPGVEPESEGAPEEVVESEAEVKDEPGVAREDGEQESENETAEVKDEVQETETEVKEEATDTQPDWDNEALPIKEKKKKKEKKDKKNKKDKKEKKEKRKRKVAENDDDDVSITIEENLSPKKEVIEEEEELVPQKKRPKADTSLLESKLVDLHTTLNSLQSKSAAITQELKYGGKEQRFHEEREFKRWKNTKKADKRSIDERCEALQSEIKKLQEERQEIQGESPFANASQFDVSSKKLTSVRVNKKADAAKHAKDAADRLLKAMDEAAEKDYKLQKQGKPAVMKLRLLPEVNRVCHRAGFQEQLINLDLLKKIQVWLRPPGGGLPVYQIRHNILNILNDFPYAGDPGRVRLKTELDWEGITREVLLETQLGTDIRRFANDPNETHENRILATKLMEKWSRVICKLSKNYKKLESQEEASGRSARFRPERFVVAADVPKFYKSGERFHADKNTDGEAAAQRCRVPQAMMPDFIKRPSYEPVSKMYKTPMQQQLERNIRKLRETRDRALVMSIEGSASTLQAESVSKKPF